MIKLSHDEQIKIAHLLGVALALREYGFSEEEIKLAFESNLPDGIVKEAVGPLAGAAAQVGGRFAGSFLGKGLKSLARWLIRGAKGGRAARLGGNPAKFGPKSFNTWEGVQRSAGQDFARWGSRPGQAAWETGKGIVGNMIFPGMVKSKSILGRGVGTGIFAKNMAGPLFGGGRSASQARMQYN